jgi:hypothetical protein
MKKIAKKTGKIRQPYPRLKELGIPVNDGSVGGPELYLALEGLDKKTGKKIGSHVKQFSKLFGCQTMSGVGPYAHDVEAVLERMLSGKLTGTQLFWD